MYEVTFLMSGITEQWTLKECNDYFGKEEFQEALQGYNCDVVAIKLN